MTRERLPSRRRCDSMKLERDGHVFYATIGYYPNGRPGEVFFDTRKSGTDIDILLHDAAIAASLALQYGCPPEDLRDAFLRDSTGAPAGIMAEVFDRISEA